MKTLIKNTIIRPFYLFVFIYLFILHGILISLIYKPDLVYRIATKLKLKPTNERVTHYIASMNTMYSRVDKNTPSNAYIFIGDSLIQGLSVTAIHPVAVNFGIGHDTVKGVSKRSLNYQSLMSASSVIISVGINDLRAEPAKKVIADYKKMLQQLPQIPDIFIHEVLPIDSKLLGTKLQEKITLFNEGLFKITKDFDNVTLLKYSSEFIDLRGDLKPSLHLGDGLHLNKKGSYVWIQQLKQQLAVQ